MEDIGQGVLNNKIMYGSEEAMSGYEKMKQMTFPPPIVLFGSPFSESCGQLYLKEGVMKATYFLSWNRATKRVYFGTGNWASIP
jgi:hypothetical protein